MKLTEAISILTEAKIENPRHDARVIFKKLGGLRDYELLSPAACSDTPRLYVR